MTTKKTTETPVPEVETNPDIEAIEAPSSTVILHDGTPVEVERLKTRQLFKLMKVITVGASSVLGSINFSTEMDPEEFASTLLGALVFAVPEAEDEALEFIQAMVSPVGLIVAPGQKLSANEESINSDLWNKFADLLANPEIEDTVAIIERVVTIEAPHIQSLGKQLSTLWRVQSKAFQAKRGASSKSE